jgi:hypothetical protein
MIRFYSLFATDDNLLSSPYVRKLNLFHDITVTRGEEETVNFLLQTPLTPKQAKELNIIYDPLSISVNDVQIKTYRHQSLVTIGLVPKELGSHKIGLAFPQSKTVHREKMNHLPSPLVSTPCQKINTDHRDKKIRVPVVQ